MNKWYFIFFAACKLNKLDKKYSQRKKVSSDIRLLTESVDVFFGTRARGFSKWDVIIVLFKILFFI
jgi:hypothetical protein